MSGSMAGMTATRGQVGKVLRRRAIPANPNTEAQQRARAQLGNLSIAWQSLTPANQAKWQEYADARTNTNALGDDIPVSARGLFIYFNTLNRLRNPAATLVAQPGTPTTARAILPNAIPNITTATTVSLIIANAPGSIFVTALETTLVMFLSQPMSPAQNPTTATFSFWGTVDGGTPPGNVRAFARSAISTLPEIRSGQRHFARIIAFRRSIGSTGAISQSQTLEIAIRP